MGFFAELRRRHVLRAAALYGAVAWLLIQVTDVISEPLGLPGWLLKVVIWLLVIGFPVALAIAWSFELTRHGLQRDTGAETAALPGISTGRKFDFAIIAALVAALGYFVATRPSGDPGAAARPASAAPRSLAVLPFANLSSSAEDGYFADGLTEELLNLLAGIEGLKVAGRTSSFYFKGRNEDLREIGRKLGVSHILEGSVRRSGERLRVTAQLVSAKDGFHLWSQVYDRELTDVFVIQDEIGRSVADALKIRLAAGGADGRPARPAVDAEAYRRYLVARSKLRERGLENTQSAVRLFGEAATIDPAFAGAHAGKALALTLLYGNHAVGDGRTMLADAEKAGRRALALDPRSSEAQVALGRVAELSWLVTGQDRRSEAGEHFRRALELDPQSTLALYWLGRFEQETNPAGAIELFDRAIELDPLEFMAASSKALSLLQSGRSDEARAEYDRLLEIYPDNPTLLRNYADAELVTGRVSHALELNARASAAGADNWSHWLDARAWWLLGDLEAARTALTKLDVNNPIQAWQRETGLAVLQRDLARALEEDRKLARHGGPAVARYAEFLSLVRNGRHAEALRLAEEIMPNMTAASPTVNGDEDICAAPDLALVLTRLGEPARAKRLADAGVAAWERTPGQRMPQDHVCRARLLAAAGRRDAALAEFERAVGLGFRGFIDWGFVSIEHDPTLDSLRDDPRFEAQMKRIRDDLARQRVAAQAWRSRLADA
jgi:TolB-like protein/Tfp pilus assembly protein PilF